MVCEVVSGYIRNMEIYSGEGKKLETQCCHFYTETEISSNITRHIRDSLWHYEG
jgi:hypothetical protein